MSKELNALLVNRYVELVWNKCQIELANELLTTDHIRHDPMLSKDVIGIESVKEQIRSLHVALPDLHFDVTIYPAADGMHVTRKWTLTGTHEGPWMDIAPTGSKIINTGIAISRILNGKIAEEWIQRDEVGFRRQIE